MKHSELMDECGILDFIITVVYINCSSLSAIQCTFMVHSSNQQPDPPSPIVPLTSLALPNPWPLASGQHSSSMGYALSPSSKLFPQTLVDKVQSGQFLEMCGLLIDNIDLLQ